MTISSIGSGVNFPPPLEFSGAQVRSEKHRAVIDSFTSSLPGTNRGTHSETGGIKRVAADMTKISQTFNRKLQFVVDPQSKDVVVKVIDKTTDKVIKVLPPEELQRLHRKLKETIGFLLDEWA